MSFREIFCQDKAIELLQKAYNSGKAAHTYIFAGPEGVGKFKTACEWAKLLLCHDTVIENDFADSCGRCRSCTLFEAGGHPDFNHIYKELREFTKDGKDKGPPVDLPIDVVREFLIAKVSVKPSLSDRKVFIVNEAERLNDSSQNSLLKVLEEPPLYCCIVLICSRLDKLLLTTKSRSQIIGFGPVAEEKIIENLEQAGLDKKRAQYLGRLAQGSLGTACQWAGLEMADAKLFQIRDELIKSLVDCQLADALELAAELHSKGKKIAAVWSDLDKRTSNTDINRRALKTIILMVISIFQDVIGLNLRPAKQIINSDQKKLIEKLAHRFNPEQSAEKIAHCYQMLNWIESSVNEKLIFEHLLLSLSDSDTMLV
jgi:DNA polymerase-3 subunit delta'